jgi:3-hydroxyisobutyrate dehydrogenase-like beta-hydroxyacid dehydrogenase
MDGMAAPICIIGFGEAGAIFGSALAKRIPVRSYDILEGTEAFRLKQARFGNGAILFAETARAAASGAKIVLSLVTAAASLKVAQEAATYLDHDQIFIDLNSVSPGTKKESAAAIERSGAAYIDGAIMAPVQPKGIAVPILLAGPAADRAGALLSPLGMNLEVASDLVGVASATKMCRSVIIKGIEALCAEAFLAARAHGVEERVLASLTGSMPGIDWHNFIGYQIERSLLHGRRRAAEMREVAVTVREVGLAAAMAEATAFRQDWAADMAEADVALKSIPEADWRRALDLLLKGTKRDVVSATTA